LLSKEEEKKNRFQKKRNAISLSLSSENSFHKVRNKRPFREKIWVTKERKNKKKGKKKIFSLFFSFVFLCFNTHTQT